MASPAAPQSLEAGFLSAMDAVAAHGLAAVAALDLLQRAEAELRKVHVPRFWAGLHQAQPPEAADGDGREDGAGESELEEGLLNSLQELCTAVEAHATLLASLSDYVLHKSGHLALPDRMVLLGLETRLRQGAAASVLAGGAPLSLSGLLHQYYSFKLASLRAVADEGADEERGGGDGDSLEAMSDSSEATLGPGWRRRLREVAGCLRQLGLEAVSEEAFAAVVCAQLRERLVASTASVFDERILEGALAHSTTVPLKFLALVLPPGEAGEGALREWRALLSYYVYETVGSLRISDMFDIVVDYPDSLPALEDIRECLAKTNLHHKFIQAFGRSIEARLLHPGAATTDILTQYVSTIKALQHIDPSGVILSAVAGPIRRYLRERKDTIRCIVTMLTDDGAEDVGTLFAELGNTEAGGEDAGADFDGPDADAQALAEAQRWEPDPVEADPSRAGRSSESSDAISMLVSIYGSKELLINEYRTMLADRLLTKTDYDCDRELRTLELLKVRFGEANLHNAEVMLRDLADSKRINANVHGVSNDSTPMKKRRQLADIEGLSATVVSALFWPQLPQEELTLPKEVQAMLDTYGAKYHSLKVPRKLVWRQGLGQVTLEVTLGGQALEFQVSPVHAAILLCFKNRPDWPAAELAKELGVTPEVLRKRAVLWINKGVLSEVREAHAGVVYRSNDQLQGSGAGGDMDAAMEEEHAPETDQQQSMRSLEPFILGMLTNFDSLPVDRIHNMLKMFVVDPPYDKSSDQLAGFLAALVAEEKLSLQGGLYRKQ
ncbi:hypothetical protein N2152v2_009886 [Parachlorella kessleri]